MKNISLLGIIRWIYYPLLVLGSMVLFIILIDLMPRKYFLSIPLIINALVIVLLLLGENVLPYKQEWQEEKGDLKTDLFQTFIGLPLASKLAEYSLPLLLYFPIMWGKEKLALDTWPDGTSLFLQFVVILLISEFLYYWIHRFSHHNPFLWRFHAVHHGAERVYWLNSGRFHFVDALLDNLFYLLPLIILPCPEEVLIGILSLNLVTGYLEHANVDFRTGILKRIFNTAELHRWHHSDKMEEGNTNFGKVLSIWDQVFGTYYCPEGKKVEKVGLSDGKKVPNDLWKQITYPFES
ncbi:MAG: sterol desaturase family protein [Bacteroidia bacterium]|nr:sterol desaturase family protein [Bacteroidia bacterium]